MSKLPFSQLSSKKCAAPGCDRYIKQEVLNRKPSATLCYRCFVKAEARRGVTVASGTAVRKRIRGGNINRPTTEDIRECRRNTIRKI